MSEESMRAEFEEWAEDWPVSRYAMRKAVSGEYKDVRIQMAWESWQASRAALVMELPKQVGFDKPFTGMPMDEMKADNSYNLALSRCRSAIEAAGVRVKP